MFINGLLIVLGILLVTVMVLLGSGFYLYHYAFKRKKTSSAVDDEELLEIMESLTSAKEWIETQTTDEHTIVSQDGLTLHANYLEAKKKTNKFVILVHGYLSDSRDMAGFAWLFHDKYGFNVLMPDLRGHGQSEGHYIGFGYHDRLDVLGWIDYLIKTYGQDIEIALLGISMGGATVNYLSGEPLPAQVKFIISDCAYDSIKNILTHHMKRLFRLPAFPLLNITNYVTKWRARYGFMDTEIKDYVARSKVPMLYIHGGSDSFVPTKMVYTLYNACPTEKKLVIIEGAKHGGAHKADSKTYEKVVEEYINKYMH